MTQRRLRPYINRLAGATLALGAASLASFGPAGADSTAQTLPFSQSWTNTGQITTSDDWSGVPGIVGYLGDDAGNPSTDRDPQTVLSGAVSTTVDVNANQTNPDTFTTGGVAEFEITDPVVALQGSGTADSPNLVLNLNTTGQSGINVSYQLRDIDSASDVVQPFALQYRVGSTGDFTNMPAGFVPDATSAGATRVTPVNAVLPAAANNQPLVQVRIITSNATGFDEFVGVDNISVTAGPPPVIPEVPMAAVLPATALALFGGGFLVLRRRQPGGSPSKLGQSAG